MENKTGKYLKYAIGEIVLVVIGILIALQINNWNESVKEKRIEIKYLKRIQSDIIKDIIYLKQKIKISENQQNSFYNYIHSMYDVQNNVKEFVALTSLVNWDSSNMILQDNTYSELTSSGKLSLLSDQILKESINDYYSNYIITIDHIKEMNTTSIGLSSYFMPMLAKYFDFSKNVFDDEKMFKKTDWIFINNPNSEDFLRLEGVAGFYVLKQSVFENYYRSIIGDSEKLLQKIENELLKLEK